MRELQRDRHSPCPHGLTDRRTVTTDFFKRTFTADVDVCRNCGNNSWTTETHERFHSWIAELKQSRRDIFQLQIYISESARSGLTRFLGPLPGIAPSALIRAMVTMYLNSHVRHAEFATILASLGQRPEYQKLIFGRRRKTSVQFSPMALLDIQSWSKKLEIPPHKIVEDAIFKLLAMRSETDADLQRFWEDHFLSQLETILRVV